MELIFESQINWSSFLKTLVWLFAVFVLLRIFRRWLTLDRFGRPFWGLDLGEYLKVFIHKALLIYEPIAVLIIATSLFLVDPIRHGPILALLIILGFPGLKNYINGRILLLSTALSRATRIQTDSIKGAVVQWERLGLCLQTDEGLRHIPYSHLVAQGFTLIAGEQMGHLVELNLTEKKDAIGSFAKLQGIVLSCPYLDTSHRPDFIEMPDHVNASLILRDEKYLPDLIQVLEEWGWEARLK
ncbi:MAG: hypothetical protein HKN76_11365 [Saprospiraceae bacterium]|nr:hypothetical protein [Saprospiraceae bacterium]